MSDQDSGTAPDLPHNDSAEARHDAPQTISILDSRTANRDGLIDGPSSGPTTGAWAAPRSRSTHSASESPALSTQCAMSSPGYPRRWGNTNWTRYG